MGQVITPGFNKPGKSVEDQKRDNFDKLYAGLQKVSELINDLVPDGREKSLALTKLEECGMWSGKGIMK